MSDTDVGHHPPARSGRLPSIVWVLSAIAICVALGFGIVAPALPIFAKNFDVGNTLAGLVISIFAATRMASAFGVGRVLDKTDARLVLAGGLLIVAVSSALAGLSQNYVQLVVLRGAGGVGSAMFSVSAASIMANRIPSTVRGRAMSIWSGSFLLGGVLGPVIGAPLVAISLRMPFFFYAATLTVGTVVALAVLPPVKGVQAQDSDGGVGNEGVREAFRLPQYRVALLGSVAQRLTTSTRSTLVPLFVVEVLMLSDAWSGYALAIAAAANAVLLLPLGRWTDTHGRLPVVLIGGLVSGIGMAALAAPPAVWLLVAAMAVLGVGTAGQAVGPSAILGDVAKGRRGSVVAAFQVSGDLGTVVGPLAAGALADLFGFATGFGVIAAICMISGLLAVPYMRSERPPASTTEDETLSDPDDTLPS